MDRIRIARENFFADLRQPQNPNSSKDSLRLIATSFERKASADGLYEIFGRFRDPQGLFVAYWP
jgi:hypothetical protein